MASTSPSCTSAITTKTAIPASSAWSKLVQITRVASNNSRSQSAEPTRLSSKSSSTPCHTPSQIWSTKRQHISDSPISPSATNSSCAAKSRPTSVVHASPTRPSKQQMLYPASGHADCTIACACRVEDVKCVAPPRLQREPVTESPGPDLQTRDEGVSASQRHKDKSCSSISEAGLVDPEEEDPSQPLNSPTRSSDSFPEADICDREDFPGAQLHLNPAQSSSQLHKMQERSIHDIGAVFAPRKKRLVLRIDQTTRRDTSRQPRSLDLNHGRHGKSGGDPFEQEEVQEAQQDLSGSESSLFTSTEPIQRVSSHAGGAYVGVAFASDTGNANEAAASCELPQSGRVNGLQDGPQDGHQGSIAKTPPKSKKRLQRRLPSTTRSNANQLDTPSTSTTPIPEAQPDQENEDDDAGVSGPALGAKSKRRLTLHSGSYNSQPPQKRRKGPPKKQAAVQTTLSLSVGGGSGMRECRVCDTVYNPFHPEDAKLHARRHAVVLKSGTSG